MSRKDDQFSVLNDVVLHVKPKPQKLVVKHHHVDNNYNQTEDSLLQKLLNQVSVMQRHRYAHLFQESRRAAGPVEVSTNGFMVCPVAVQQLMGIGASWQQRTYELALEEARKVVRPSILERFAADTTN
jgi:hypothetical protein